MNEKVLNYWERVRSSYWFLPSVMAIASAFIALATVTIDRSTGTDWMQDFVFIWSGGAEGARELLSTLAGSAISVAGVTFSITIVAFSLASSQFGSRVLYNFMRDPGNQIVLGTFVSTFIFCLLVLRTVRSEDFGDFVPHLSITVAILFAIANIGVLIYFFHHVSETVQASYIIRQIAGELQKQTDQVFPSLIGQEADDPAPQDSIPGDFDTRFAVLRSHGNGYLQVIDNKSLIHVCQKNDLMMRLLVRPGAFLISQEPIAYLYPEDHLDDELEKALIDVFLVGKQQTYQQNIEYSIQQMVEIAVRSLSDAVNDPFTTIMCINWLGAMLAALIENGFPSPYRFDSNGDLRVVVDQPVTFQGIADLIFNPIRQQADDQTIVYLHLLETITGLMPLTRTESARSSLMYHATMIRRAGHAKLQERNDRTAIEEAFEEVVSAPRLPNRARAVS